MTSSESIMFSVRHKLVLAFLALIGTILVLLSTSLYGAGLSPDSVGYIAITRNLVAGVGAVTHSGSPLVVCPPLYPTLLALIGYISEADPLAFVHIVNALIFGLIVYLSGLLTFRYVTSPIVALFGAVTVLVSKPLFEVSVMAWSEPLFILFVLLMFLYTHSYLTKRDRISFLLLSLFGAFSFLTRYVGITIMLFGILIIILFYKNSLKTKIFLLGIFVLISGMPVGLWTLRNYALSGTFFGPRAPSPRTLSENLLLTGNTFLHWYIPKRIAEHYFILILLLGLIAGYLVSLSLRSDWEKTKVALLQVSPMALFSIIYLTFLVLSSTTTRYDKIHNRLLSPVYIPTMICTLTLVESVFRPLKKRFSDKTVNLLLILCISGWLLYPTALVGLDAINRFHQGAGGYNSKQWRKSATIQYLRQQSLSHYPIYSNFPDALYILANLSSQRSPAKDRSKFLKSLDETSDFRGVWPAEERVYLIWFDNHFRTYLFTVDELQTVADTEPIARLNDGTIYVVSRR